jgi:putative transposase
MGKTLLSADKYYHIYNHACGNEELFHTHDNYLYFLRKFSEYVNPVSYAYCLMPNHFHFLLQIKSEQELLLFFNEKYGQRLFFQNQNFKSDDSGDLKGFQNLEGLIAQQFSNFFNAYTKAFNKLYHRKGNLFLVNFRRKEINDVKYLKKMVHYIHFNPVHHNFVENLQDWKYSSYEAFISSKVSNLKREKVIKWFDDITNFLAYHKEDIKDFEPKFD